MQCKSYEHICGLVVTCFTMRHVTSASARGWVSGVVCAHPCRCRHRRARENKSSNVMSPP
eukprot:2079577-Pyramimonas_sp.AAC.1